MKFAQKLGCAMVLVLAVSFSAGGCALLYGDFADRLAEADTQNQAQHSLACYAVESEILSLYSLGDAITGEDLAAQVEELSSTAPEGSAFALWYQNEMVWGELPGDILPADMGSSQLRYIRTGDTVSAVYCTDLLDGARLFSVFDVTSLYDARTRSLLRFLTMEGVVLLCSAGAAARRRRRMTRPLALLNQVSGEIAAGAYDRRTAVPGNDEVAQLSRSFDHMAAAVEDKVAQLELSVQQRDDFMGAFTHELKTPMTSIIGYADMLRSVQCDPDEQKEAANAIFHEAKRLESLSRKLLQLLHLSDEALTLGPVELERVLAAAEKLMTPVCRKAGVTLRMPALRTFTVRGDADLLIDLLCNLTQNAVKASHEGQIVEILCRPRRDGAILLGVADAGIGIPAQAVSRVTEPFYMVDKSRARKSGGSGLGLALCSSIARAHGTELRIQSREGRGTCVTVTLNSIPSQGGDTP